MVSVGRMRVASVITDVAVPVKVTVAEAAPGTGEIVVEVMVVVPVDTVGLVVEVNVKVAEVCVGVELAPVAKVWRDPAAPVAKVNGNTL